MSFNVGGMDAQVALVQQSQSVPKIDKNVDDKALREQTDAFESVIVKMLLDNSMKDDNDIFSSQKDPGDKIYKSMYREELSKASAGSFGFSEMLYDYLSEKR
jgi:Rod binding domain-containing protein